MASQGLSLWLTGKSEALDANDPRVFQNQVEDTGKPNSSESPLELPIDRIGVKETITLISPEKCLVVEEIDSEEDDAEFDDRAHWTRRGSRKKARAMRRAAGAEEKSQPSIALFCVKNATSTKEVLGAELKKAALNDVVKPAKVVQLDKTNHTKCEKMEKPKNDGLEWDSADTPTKNGTATFMSSGRPKRESVLRAEILQQQQKLLDAVAAKNNAVSFLTPPPSTKKSSTQKATTSGRKRKLELNKKKASPTLKNGSTVSPPSTSNASQSFFLSELEKKQLQEIETVSIFREQLRQTREKDLAFFAGKPANPFFQARSCCIRSGGEESDDENVRDSDVSKIVQHIGARWSKPLPLFPDVQHVLYSCMDEKDLDTATQNWISLIRRVTSPDKSSKTVVIHQANSGVDSKLSIESMAHLRAAMNGQVCTESSFSEQFWFREFLNSSTFPGVEIIDITSPCLSNSEMAATELAARETLLVDELVEAHGIQEIQIRELLSGLEQARIKRTSRKQNLSLVDRYLPVNANGLVGNRETLHTLSSWLSAWKIGGGDRKRLDCFASELFTFEDGDSDSEDEVGDLCRLFILQGESGSGKSAAVYACAEELGYEIIEINAAQNRSGKNIVELCGEATQSTRVLHIGGKYDKSKKTHKKKRRIQSEGRKSLDKPTAASLSLVLFEDVDLVFDDDKGFLCAICSIAKHSKCPIVVTCAQLPDAFPTKPGRLCRELCKPTMDEFSIWMRLVTFIEGMQVAPSLIDALAKFFGRDVRRSLHFLEASLPVSNTSLKTHWRWQHVTDDESDDDKYCHVVVPAWTVWSTGDLSFDALTSNLLSELSAAYGKPLEDKGYEERRADLEAMSELAEIMDSTSVADTWMSPAASWNRGEIEKSYFQFERERLAALELRRLSLYVLGTSVSTLSSSLTHRQEPSASACIQRTLDNTLKATQRHHHQAALAQLKPKFELPLAFKGCGKSEPRFTLDYMPMVGRLLSSTGLQEGRRRASRRNHYLSDVLNDMALIDELPAFNTYLLLDGDSFVAVSSAHNQRQKEV
ncbi:putative P-loop containing nucleoside triphosphate hydrolase [Plasmopara halstedii]